MEGLNEVMVSVTSSVVQNVTTNLTESATLYNMTNCLISDPDISFSKALYFPTLGLTWTLVFLVLHFLIFKVILAVDSWAHILEMAHVKDLNNPKTILDSSQKAIYFTSYTVSTIHALVASFFAIFLSVVRYLYPNHWLVGNTAENSICGFSEYMNYLLQFSLGYFIYDLISMIVFPFISHYTIVIHHLCCISVYYLSNTPIFMSHLTRFLIYEVSTIFMNFLCVMDRVSLELLIL